MKSSNIGGQAVLEGIMMKNKDEYAVAVRKPDGNVEVDKKEYRSVVGRHKMLLKIPFVRGVFAFVDSLVLGMKTLAFSASFFEEEDEMEAGLTKKEEEKKERAEKWMMGGTIALSIVLAIAIFMVLPYLLSSLLKRAGASQSVFAVCEGMIKIAIFLGYMVLISRMKDIKRVFMYHGAEHKCINCIENGFELNVENVRKSSRLHKRCGTSFLLFVILVSIILHFFVQFDSMALNLAVRLALIPVIAGISYEIIRLAGNSESGIVCAVSKPGLMLQKLTTKEPEDDMIEVAILAVEAVFDWKEYQKETFKEVAA
ncbi:DUF1385 domain-containing protein [Lachnoclostridium sp. An181]|uniref:DUF1385 domain-containing protein n=1 Tax=Lachnoclostridium sp. An181 TaxID=1965575 RepID=UPI000B3893E5|nr:DUF1385 domain-containing protein [Lachnoclostridium sp. An181]OUP50661.1 hypothetical protein B5F18_03240 [Lachnoclostridium sp. An181]